MPYKEGKRWRGTVMVGGERRSKLFSTKSKARAWEANEKRQEGSRIPSISLAESYTEYLEIVQLRHSHKTFQEKHFLGRRMIKEWDDIASQKNELKSGAKRIKDIADNLALSGADVAVLQSEVEKVLNHSFLVVAERPSTPEKVEMALVVARSMRNEITQLLESKKAELE